jgi:tyrosine-protein kinase Etk/Wzc
MNLSNNGQSKVHPQGGFAEGENEIKKYLRILKRRKWLILATLLIVSLGWVVYVVLYESQPVYSSSALLHFQNPKEMSAVESGGRTFNTSRMTFLETNSLLGQIVEELQLNFSIITENIGENDLFQYVHVNAESVPGEYKMADSGDKFNLYYSNEDDGIKDRYLLSFNTRDTIQINNFALGVNNDFVLAQSKKEFEFLIKNYDAAIKSLKSKITYKWLDRKSLTNLSITASSRSPQMAAKIANTLAEKFVEFDSQINNRKNEEVLKILEEQLIVAKQDLDGINQRIQWFKERNPMVTDANPVVAITSLEQNKNTARTKIQEINNLISQYRNAPTFEDKLDNSRQLLSYLAAAEGIPSATVFEEELAVLTTERNSYFGQYAPSHSVFQQNEAKFGTLFKKIENVALEQVSKLEGSVANLDSNISVERGNLARLPYKQRQLSELVIDQGVKRAVYETVLSRYNKAKIDSKVEVGDVFVLDRAQVPPEQGRLSLILTNSLLGIALGLGLGVGLAIVREFFDKTVQTQEDLEGRLRFPVIGSIPVIHSENEVPDNIRDLKGKRDTKLITLDYSPTLESESYRDIRTKLLFMNENQQLSSFLVTSLRPGEGKSLTASNLAVTFAQQKISTLLIDGDLRRGVLHNVYGNKKKPGLGDFLISKATVDYQNLSKLIQKTIIPNLYLVTAGSPLPNPTEMLGSERMVNVMSVLKSRFGMVILDTAPFQATSDAAILSSVVGGILIVVRAEHTNIELLNRKLLEYRNIQENILGLVLNMVKADAKKERYQYSYYNY